MAENACCESNDEQDLPIRHRSMLMARHRTMRLELGRRSNIVNSVGSGCTSNTSVAVTLRDVRSNITSNVTIALSHGKTKV
jgi:hypothetical protein